MSDQPASVHPVCERCGRVHERRQLPHLPPRPTCAKHRTRKDEDGRLVPCMQWQLPGSDCCGFHGGGARQVRAAAEARVQQQQLQEVARRHAVPIDMAPLDGLRERLAVRLGWVVWWEQQVEGLDPRALIHGVRGIQRTEKVGFQAGTTTATDVGPALHIAYEQYLAAQAAYEKLAVEMVKLGYDERRLDMERQEAARIAASYRWLYDRQTARLRAAGVDPSPFQDALRGDFVDALRNLTLGTPFPSPELPAA